MGRNGRDAPRRVRIGRDAPRRVPARISSGRDGARPSLLVLLAIRNWCHRDLERIEELDTLTFVR